MELCVVGLVAYARVCALSATSLSSSTLHSCIAGRCMPVRPALGLGQMPQMPARPRARAAERTVHGAVTERIAAALEIAQRDVAIAKELSHKEVAVANEKVPAARHGPTLCERGGAEPVPGLSSPVPLRYPYRGAARGRGAPTLTSLDLARTKFRLDGLNSYSVVSALVMNAALRLLTTSQSNDNHDPLAAATVALSAVSALCGVHSAVMFTLVCLYSKTAIGMSTDEAFARFFQATASMRQRGFASFVACLFTFTAALVTATVTRLSHRRGGGLFLAALAVAAMASWKEWAEVVLLGRRLIFRG